MAKSKENINATNKHEFGTKTSKILQLMIHSLYAEKDIFLRELISNASDASDKLRYESQTNPKLLDENHEFKIEISSNILKENENEQKELLIRDYGIGLNEEDMINNLGTIASSGTQEFLENLQKSGADLKNPKEKSVQLIGQFGVGFYSSFMVSDKVTVFSKKAGSDKIFKWQSNGDDSYEIEDVTKDKEIIEKYNLGKTGTLIILTLREDCEQYADKHRIKHIVKTYSDHISFDLVYLDEKGDKEIINQSGALWTKQKKDIKKEEYNNFYKNISHAADEPWMVIHQKTEGILEYTNLLFIPSMPPFDLFHPDRMTRVKLYVKRVFIADDKIELVPKYLRFIRGIVDSEDLPLNVSRETLQHNNILHKIKNNVVKKVLSELKKKSEKDKPEFLKFWQNFGAILKEGLCEPNDTNRENLFDVCHFYTSKNQEAPITLDEYIKNMKDGQKKIYYAIGDDKKTLLDSPQIEGFLKKDIEVILLTDHVDDFWVNTANIYKEIDLVSISRSGIDIEANDNEKSADEDKKDEKSDKESDFKIVLDYMKEVLKNKVLDVKESHKLSSSPVCLTVSEGGMDIRMERFLINQKQLAAPSLKILEINKDHRVVKFIENEIKNNKSSKLAKDYTELLYDQACIIEGEPISDQNEFVRRFNELLVPGH